MNEPRQLPPQGDNRYRVHRSARCYIAELSCGTIGCTWYLSDSIERVVYIDQNDGEKVLYKNRFYALQTPDALKILVEEHLRSNGAVHIGGHYLHSAISDLNFEAFSFIDTTSEENKTAYRQSRLAPSD